MNDGLGNGLRIWFDLQPLQTPHEPERGIPRHAFELALALRRQGAPIAAFGLNPWLPATATALSEPTLAPLVEWASARSFSARAEGGALVHHVVSPFEAVEPRESVFPPYVRRPHASVVTIHDLIPYVFPDQYQQTSEARQFFGARRELVRQADLFVTVSEHSRRDLIELFGVEPERCVVTGGGVSEYFRPPGGADDPAGLLARAVPALTRPFVLSVAGTEWRKNNETLFAAYAALPADVRRAHQLVVATRLTDQTRRWFNRQLSRHGLEPGRDVVLTGLVTDETLRALYQRSSLYVFPSRYEGFGLPVLEAARCGAVAIVADTSSLPEILESPEATFPPDDADALAELMVRALGDEALRSRLRAAGDEATRRHTWDHVATRTLAAYELLPPPRRGSRRRPAVAVVAPFRSGPHRLRETALALVSALAPDAEVDCFADGEGNLEAVPGAERTLPAAALGRPCDPHAYDAVVCVLGDDLCLVDTRAAVLAAQHAHHAVVLWLADDSYEELELDDLTRGAEVVVAGPAGTAAVLDTVRELVGAPAARS